MSKEDKYFQFPVSALRMNARISNVPPDLMVARLKAITLYCCVEAGEAWYAKQEPYASNAFYSNYCASEDREDNNDPMEYHACGGAELLKVSLRDASMDDIHDAHYVINRNRTAMQIRVRRDIFLDALKGDFTWREFAILCGVFAGIGGRKESRLTFDRINALSLGYQGQRTLGKAHKWSLERHQIKYTVRSLSKRGFFQVASPDRRNNYYSLSLSLRELAEVLAKKRSDSKATPSARETTALIQKIAANRGKNDA